MVVLSLLQSCATEVHEPPTASLVETLIHGADDRRDLYQLANELASTLARQSTLVLLAETPTDAFIDTSRAPTLGDAQRLCGSEAFVEQPVLGRCSGLLVNNDLIVTAAHCVRSPWQCENQVWVFGFGLEQPDSYPVLQPSDQYRCRSMTVAHDDLALVQLDHPISSDRKAAVVSTDPLAVGDDVMVIGYPNGLPVKVDEGARVLQLRPDGSGVELTSDTFIGSSGSGVFDAQGQLTAVLVRGREDYIYDEARTCWVSRRIEPAEAAAGIAEVALYATNAISALCAAGWTSEKPCQTARENQGQNPALREGPDCTVTRHVGDAANGHVLCVTFWLLLVALAVYRARAQR